MVSYIGANQENLFKLLSIISSRKKKFKIKIQDNTS